MKKILLSVAALGLLASASHVHAAVCTGSNATSKSYCSYTSTKGSACYLVGNGQKLSTRSSQLYDVSRKSDGSCLVAKSAAAGTTGSGTTDSGATTQQTPTPKECTANGTSYTVGSKLKNGKYVVAKSDGTCGQSATAPTTGTAGSGTKAMTCPAGQCKYTSSSTGNTSCQTPNKQLSSATGVQYYYGMNADGETCGQKRGTVPTAPTTGKTDSGTTDSGATTQQIPTQTAAARGSLPATPAVKAEEAELQRAGGMAPSTVANVVSKSTSYTDCVNKLGTDVDQVVRPGTENGTVGALCKAAFGG